MTPRNLYLLLFAAYALGLFCCAGASNDGLTAQVDLDGPITLRPDEPVEVVGAEAPVTDRAEARRLTGQFDERLEKVRGLTPEAFRASHRPGYLAEHGLDVTKARFHDSFVKTFALTAAERAVLGERGFLVINSPAVRARGHRTPQGRGPADVYYRVFAADLPVFVSADSILHAWHRTYDAVLESSETVIMLPLLRQVLRASVGSLDASRQDQRDALLYLGTALSLLDPRWQVDPAIGAEVAVIRSLVDRRTTAPLRFMGQTVEIDFSQFEPRGHYTESEALQQYFQAMMWLGRTDLVLWDPDTNGPANPREEAAARAMASALQRSGALDEYQRVDRFYRVHVGRPNALTPVSLLEICNGAGAADCSTDDTSRLFADYSDQGAPAYSSRLPDTDRVTVAMRFFPQRFAFDAWVTARTTTPELSRDDGGRSMASPLDVAFVLGADRAAEHLAADMARFHRENLPATLEALRQTFRDHPPTSVDDTIYNHWLEALGAVARPRLGDGFPRVMRTAEWNDRQIETVLGSWTEMRHDTILVVEQSMGGIGCQYPEGYVEPVPELYRSLAQASGRLLAAYEVVPEDFGHLESFVQRWQDVMERLATLSETELRGEAMSAEDLQFLDHTVDRHANGYGGARSYDGWYPDLYWHRDWRPNHPPGSNGMMSGLPHAAAGRSEPVVADVHTDADQGLVLEVGVGHPEMLIVAIDTESGVGLFGGPVYSFRSFHQPMNRRMNDNEWRRRVASGLLPDRPSFTRSYRAQ